jgi:hypothetical protein
MRDLQKIGGAAALIEAATYVIGLGLFFTFLAPYYGSDDPDLGQFVAFLAANRLLSPCSKTQGPCSDWA